MRRSRQNLKAAQAEAARLEAGLISNTRQITFEGRRAGEGYFSADGTRMVFQSERDPSNPFYQIYVTDLETGDIEKGFSGSRKDDLRVDPSRWESSLVRKHSAR